MATNTVQSIKTARTTNVHRGLPYDRLFFSVTAWLMVVTVFVGFSHTYYLAGVFHAPLPSRLLHVHGVIFTAWMLLLVTQTSLVSSGRVNLHRKLGVSGFLLGCAMVPLGLLAGTGSLVRGFFIKGRNPQAFYIIPVTDMIIFGTLLFFAFRHRRNPAEHKRLIYMATTALLPAAFGRMPLPGMPDTGVLSTFYSYLFVVVLIAYDLWSAKKVLRSTLWGSVFLIFVQQVRFPLGKTMVWQSLATWIRNHAGI